MPPKRTAHPAKQQALFQAGRPVHKARSSASAAVNKQSKGKKPLPPASRPSPSHEVDLVDLRTSSPVRRDDDSDSEDALDFDIPEPSSDSQVPSSPQDSVTPRRVPSHSSSPVQSIRKENFGDPIPSVKGLPDLDIDDPAFDSFWELTKRRLRYRYVKPIHATEENRVQLMLRVFDLDPAFGPCRGMGRLERWQRAYELGLDPPEAIRLMLESKQGQMDLNRSVLDTT